MADPVFDPTQPFENVGSGAPSSSAPAFDPSQPFENVEQPSKSWGDRLSYAWENATPGGPLWLVRELAQGAVGAVQGSEAATAPQVGSEEDVGNLRELAERGPRQAARAVAALSPGAPEGSGGLFGAPEAAGAAARAISGAGATSTPTEDNPIYAAADRIRDATGQQIDVPSAFASNNQTVQRAGQMLRNVPIAGNPIPQAVGRMTGQVGEALNRTASSLGEGSGPNAARRVSTALEQRAADEDAARAAAHQSEVDAANAQVDQHEAQAAQAAQATTGPAMHPQDIGQAVTDALMRGHTAAQQAKRTAYTEANANAEAEIDRSHIANWSRDIADDLDASGFSLDPEDHRQTAKALQAIGNIEHVQRPGERPPRPLTPEPAAPTQTDRDVADIETKFGPQTAAAYARQQAERPPSLTQFLAGKGGLSPHGDLSAMDAQRFRINIPGRGGRYSLVKQGGLPLDTAREMAEEAGYLRGTENATSTERDLLDAIDAELRGRPTYPMGYESTVTPREARTADAAAAAANERRMQDFRDDLEAAGHGDLNPDIHQRAVELMDREGLDADTAADRAFNESEQQASFPGNTPLGSTANMRGIQKLIRRLNTAARSAANDADAEGVRRVRDLFHERVNDAIDAGLFHGSEADLAQYREANRLNRAWRENFGYNARDRAGRLLNEVATGRRDADDVANFLYGSTKIGNSPVALDFFRQVMRATGDNPDVRQAIGAGVMARITGAGDANAAKPAAAIVDDIRGLFNRQGRTFAREVFTPEQRQRWTQFADVLERATEARKQIANRAKQPIGVGPLRQLAKDAFGEPGSMSDEAMFNALYAYAQSGGRADINTLAGVMRMVPEAQRGDLAGAFVRNLGRDSSGNFSPDRYVTQYAKISPQAKAVLFGNAGGWRQSLDDIATISARIQQVGRRFGNPSGTAQVGIGFAEVTSFMAHPLATIAGVMGGYGLARILSAPRPARTLSNWMKAAARMARDKTPESIASYSRASIGFAREAKQLGVPLEAALINGLAQRQVIPAARENQN